MGELSCNEVEITENCGTTLQPHPPHPLQYQLGLALRQRRSEVFKSLSGAHMSPNVQVCFIVRKATLECNIVHWKAMTSLLVSSNLELKTFIKLEIYTLYRMI